MQQDDPNIDFLSEKFSELVPKIRVFKGPLVVGIFYYEKPDAGGVTFSFKNKIIANRS